MMHAFSLAQLILSGFAKHYQLFQEITGQAPIAFATQDWGKIQQISKARIHHYDARVNETINDVKELLNCDVLDEAFWYQVKQHYLDLLTFHPQAELAETFYNSVFCRLFDRQYFNNDFIFVETTLKDAPAVAVETEYRSYFPVVKGLKPTIKQIINEFDFQV